MSKRLTCSAIVAALSASAAWAGTGLDVKTGLWTVTTTTDIQGSMIPAAAMANIPPAQRAKIEAAMKARSAAGPKSHVTKNCVTEKDLQDGAFRADKEDRECVYKITSQTATRQEGTMVCGGDEKRTGKIKIEALSREHVKGQIDIVSERGRVAVQLDSQWVGANCGNVK